MVLSKTLLHWVRSRNSVSILQNPSLSPKNINPGMVWIIDPSKGIFVDVIPVEYVVDPSKTTFDVYLRPIETLFEAGAYTVRVKNDDDDQLVLDAERLSQQQIRIRVDVSFAQGSKYLTIENLVNADTGVKYTVIKKAELVSPKNEAS